MQQIDEGDSRADAEWLLTNGLGGFSSTMVSGALGRRYHGYLIAALPPPLGRVVMLSGMTEWLVAAPVDGEREPVDEATLAPPPGASALRTVAFRIERRVAHLDAGERSDPPGKARGHGAET